MTAQGRSIEETAHEIYTALKEDRDAEIVMKNSAGKPKRFTMSRAAVVSFMEDYLDHVTAQTMRNIFEKKPISIKDKEALRMWVALRTAMTQSRDAMSIDLARRLYGKEAAVSPNAIETNILDGEAPTLCIDWPEFNAVTAKTREEKLKRQNAKVMFDERAINARIRYETELADALEEYMGEINVDNTKQYFSRAVQDLFQSQAQDDCEG